MTPDEHTHIQRLEAKVKRYRNRIALLKDALIRAKATIREWQNIESGNMASEEAWRLYQQSPEMKEINAALATNIDS